MRACVSRGIAMISVAHRPALADYHDVNLKVSAGQPRPPVFASRAAMRFCCLCACCVLAFAASCSSIGAFVDPVLRCVPFSQLLGDGSWTLKPIEHPKEVIEAKKEVEELEQEKPVLP